VTEAFVKLVITYRNYAKVENVEQCLRSSTVSTHLLNASDALLCTTFVDYLSSQEHDKQDQFC
jgi:hypothetical protein